MTYQVSVFLENKLGHFGRVTSVLREAGVNIRTMTLTNTASGWGILNFVVDAPKKACRALCDKGFSAALREIVALSMDDELGGLDTILKNVESAGISFQNAYGRIVQDGHQAFLVIDVEDVDDALKRLHEKGIVTLSPAEVYGREIED